MDQQQQGLETLQDIKRIMERSSRFISLSGWSGVSAGVCALVGAWLARNTMTYYLNTGFYDMPRESWQRAWASGNYYRELFSPLAIHLLFIAIGVFIAAVALATLFTYIRSRKNKLPMWNNTARRLLWNTLLPLLVGGIVILKLLDTGGYALIAPMCLIFYGLALVNGSKYTLGEVKYLGYGQLLLGIINLWEPGYGLLCWALGFGVLHIVYGIVMWWKYERK